MLKAFTGASTNRDAKTAGLECAEKLRNGLSRIKMAFAYASSEYNLNDLLAGIRERLPNVPVIGNTSCRGVILPEGYVGGDCFVGMMALEDETMTVGIAAGIPDDDDDAAKAGREAALAAMRKAGRADAPDYFYMAVTPGYDEDYLAGVREVIGPTPFFGGGASDNEQNAQWMLFTDAGAHPDGVALAFFYTARPIVNLYTGAHYRATGEAGIATKVIRGRRIVEIDGQPALQKLAEWMKYDPELLSGSDMWVACLLSPLGIKAPNQDFISIRQPAHGHSNGSVDIGSYIEEGSRIMLMESTPEEMVDSGGKTLNALKSKMPFAPGAFHLVNSNGCYLSSGGGRMDEAAEKIIREAGGVPFIGEFTVSEMGSRPDESPYCCGNLMMSFTGFCA